MLCVSYGHFINTFCITPLYYRHLPFLLMKTPQPLKLWLLFHCHLALFLCDLRIHVAPPNIVAILGALSQWFSAFTQWAHLSQSLTVGPPGYQKQTPILASFGVAKSRAWLSDCTFTFHLYALEKEMATHSSVLAWRIPGMESHRVGHDWSDLVVAVAVLTPLIITCHLSSPISRFPLSLKPLKSFFSLNFYTGKITLNTTWYLCDIPSPSLPSSQLLI